MGTIKISGVTIKNGSVLLTMEKGRGRVWRCPSFDIKDGEDPFATLTNGMKQALHLDVVPDNVIYKNEDSVFVCARSVSGQLENAMYENAKWVDIENISNLDVVNDSRIAILKYELMGERKI